jgi:hypothetical protein
MLPQAKRDVRPDNRFVWNQPHNSYYLQDLRGGCSNQTVNQMEARFACGSMVLLFSFAQKNSQREFFCAKDLVTSALPEPALSVVEWGDLPAKRGIA